MALATLSRPRHWISGRLPPLRPPWVVLFGFLLLAMVAWAIWSTYFATRQTQTVYQTAQVTRGNIAVSISATGPVTNPISVPLTFKNSGRLAEIYVKVGDRVAAGQVLARLDTTDLEAQVAQARANLENAAANEATVRAGPTDEEIAQARATFEAAGVELENARRALEAVEASAAAAVAVAEANVESARVDLANAQKNLASTREQMAATLASDSTALGNAQAAYQEALKSFQAAFAEAEQSSAANKVAVQNAVESVGAAEAGLQAAREQADRTLAANMVAVANAKQSLQDAQREFAEAKQVAEANVAVARRQVDESRASLNVARAQRDQACSSNANSSSGNSCSVARRQVDVAERSLRTAEAQRDQTEAQSRQSVASAAAQVTSAQNNLNAAEAALNSGIASSRQSITSAENAVVSARNTLKTAQATLASGQAQNQSTLASARNTLTSAENAILTAQRTLERDRASQQAAVTTAENSVEQATATLATAQKNLENTRAQQADSVQTARNAVAQQEAALATAEATYRNAIKPPTPAEIEAAHAQTESQRQALQMAQNDLDAAVLVAPTDGTVSFINAAAGQWVTGGSVNTNVSSTSGTISATSSSGTTNTSAGFISLSDVSSPQVTPQISEADIGRVRPGQRVSFTVNAYPGRTFTGTVATIQPAGQTVSNVVSFNVVCTVDPTDVQLLPNMTATVEITTDERNDVIVVPNAAISYARTQGQAAGGPAATASPTPAGEGEPATVLVLRNGQPVPTRIRVGLSDDRNTEVLAGLEPGDQVITGATTTTQGGAGTKTLLPSVKPGGGQQKPNPAQKPDGG